MTTVINRSPKTAPVHVLIIVVGTYLPELRALEGAGDFAQQIVNFWRSPERRFPANQTLETVEVLVSDPSVKEPRILYENTQPAVAAPSFQNVNDALRLWVGRIKQTEGAVGFLHWVGHGGQLLGDGGTTVVLHTDGKAPDGRQDGLDWTTTLGWLNDELRDRRVYCFIDSCRLPIKDRNLRVFHQMGPYDPMAMDNSAYVFMSTGANSSAFWVAKPKLEAANAGLKKYAMGTNAFLQSLEGFGARYIPGATSMPIAAAELVEASRHLMRRWAAHQKLDMRDPEGPPSPDEREILITQRPQSIVNVFLRNGSSAAACAAQAQHPDVIEAETNQAPFQFRLSRKPHKFRLDDKGWGREVPLVHPHADLYDGESYT